MRRILLSLLALSFSVSAAEAVPRIGLVDSKAVFESYKGTKEAQERYDKQVASWEQDVADKQKELASLKEKFDKQGMMLSEERKRNLQNDFMSKQAELQKMVQGLYGKDGKVVKENEKFTAPIIQKIRGVAQQVAKAEGFDLVLDRASGAVFYVGKDDWDLTQKVIDRLNSEFIATEPATEPVKSTTKAAPKTSDTKGK